MRLRIIAPRLLGCLLFVMLFGAPAALAQSDDGSLTFNAAGISDGCGDTMNADECMASGSGFSSTLCKQDACPACGFNDTMTASICFRVRGQYGYCSCTAAGIAYDKNGNKIANCNASGSCTPLQ